MRGLMAKPSGENHRTADYSRELSAKALTVLHMYFISPTAAQGARGTKTAFENGQCSGYLTRRLVDDRADAVMAKKIGRQTMDGIE